MQGPSGKKNRIMRTPARPKGEVLLVAKVMEIKMGDDQVSKTRPGGQTRGGQSPALGEVKLILPSQEQTQVAKILNRVHN